MSVTRVHRLLRLVTLLQGEQSRSLRELMGELGVSRRTFFRDLKMLEAAGIPCYHEPQSGYRIARTFFLPPVNLSVCETLGLMLLAKHAAAQRHQPMFAAALSAIYKLITMVPEPIRTACGDMMTQVSIDPGTRAAGDAEMRFFATVQRCIDEGRVCRVEYKSPVEPDVMRFDLRPYALHFTTRAWYVLGHSDLHDQVRTFKLVRFLSVDPLQRLFKKPAKFKLEDQLGQAWQLIPEGAVYDVELEFTPKVAANVTEVRWHASQQHQLMPDGSARLSFTVDGLGEIAWWICGYADQVTVRKPAALRKRVREMHLAAAQKQLKQPRLFSGEKVSVGACGEIHILQPDVPRPHPAPRPVVNQPR